MFGISASYNSVPRMRELISSKIISPDGGGINPVDLGPVELPNIRGQVTYTIISGDNLFMSMFKITGGFGEWPEDSTQNWSVPANSEVNCIVKTAPQRNRIEVTTPSLDAGGRMYIFNFVPYQSFGPNIQQTSINIIGNNTLTVKAEKTLLVH
jgi:hypothetical protein